MLTETQIPMHTSFDGIFHSIHCYTENCVLIFYEQQHRNMHFGCRIFQNVTYRRQNGNEKKKHMSHSNPIHLVWLNIRLFIFVSNTNSRRQNVTSMGLSWREYVYSNSSMWPIDDGVYQRCYSFFFVPLSFCVVVAFNLFLNNSQIYIYTQLKHTHTPNENILTHSLARTLCDFRLEIGIPQTIFIWPLKNELLILTQHFICILF